MKPSPEEPSGVIRWSAPERSKFINPWDSRPLLDYYLSLLRAYGYIRLLGLPQLKDNPDIPIESLFVEPQFSDQPIPADRQVDEWPERLRVTEALLRYPRIVVLGDPGIGKTSLMQWLITQFSRSSESPLQGALGPLVPMPFVLRELPLTPDLNWNSLLSLFLSQPVAEKLRSVPRLCERLLARGQAIIMLDGLDEVSGEETRNALRAAVLQGILKYNSCRWIMTSRVVGYDRTQFHLLSKGAFGSDRSDDSLKRLWEDTRLVNAISAVSKTPDEVLKNVSLASSEVLYLAPFDDHQIERLVRNWYGQREADPNRRDECIKDLLRGIREHSGTEKLARIPNLLTMMTLIHRVRARLPQGRVNLYGDIAEAYLQTIDEFRGIREVGYSLSQKKHWLARIAFEMQRKRKEGSNSSFTEDAAAGILADRKEVLIWLGDIIDSVDPSGRELAATKFLDYLQRRTGLFLERSPGRFSFLHLSFQEYFAACYLAEEVTGPDWLSPDYDRGGSRPIDLQSHAGTPLWKETLVFLFELLGQQRPRWVDTVARKVFASTMEKPDRSKPVDEDSPFSWHRHTDVILLAELSVDAYSGFSQSLREVSWRTIWRCAFVRSPYVLHNPSADALLGGAPHFADAIWQSLASVGEALQDRTLNLTECGHLTDVSHIRRVLAVEDLDLWHSPVRQGLAELAGMPRLHGLSLDWPGQLRDPGELGSLTHLTTLTLCPSQPELSVGQIPLLPNLRGLYLVNYDKLVDIESFRNWSQLEHFGLWPRRPNEDVQEVFVCLQYLVNLHSLSVGDSHVIQGLKELPLVSSIEELTIYGFSALHDLHPNRSLTRVKYLLLKDCPRVSDLSPLVELTELEDLEFHSCPEVVSLEALAACSNLKRIHVRDCRALTDIPPSLRAIVIRK